MNDRRSFLKTLGALGAGVAAVGAAASAGAAAAPTTASPQPAGSAEPKVRPAGACYLGDFGAPKLDRVRFGVIGLGERGSVLAEILGQIEGSEVVAISDLYPDYCQRTVAALAKAGRPAPQIHQGDPQRYRELLARPDLDAVVIATPWELHAPMAIAALQAGKHAFVEVPLAPTLPELWAIIDAAERAGRHCMMLENCNYGREELFYLNLCRQGVLGELLHAEAAYIHELRFQMKHVERGTGSWRTPHYAPAHGGNLYPTHGLGPVAQYLSLARTEDNFERLVSFSSPGRGRTLAARKNFPPEHRWNQLKFEGGDISTQIIKTQLGRTVLVQWDETSPRPYSRHDLVQGTQGTVAGFPPRAAIEGRGDYHKWLQGEAYDKLRDEFEHPLYRRLGAQAEKLGGHGGMDSIMLLRLVECLRRGEALDQNLYEGAYWSAVRPLSAASEAAGGAPQVFPDFTRGGWRTTKPLGIVA